MKIMYQSKIVVSAVVGGIIEMFDFVIYLFFSSLLAQLFFPKENQAVALMLTLAIFAIGYLARPLGGIFFGHIADRQGRRKGLVLSVFMMAIPIFLIAILPTYQSIGIAAPTILLLCRIVQGLSIGGEFPSALTFVAEHSPNHRRGYYCSWLFFGVNIGLVLGSAVTGLIDSVFSQQTMLDFGWRLPFFAGSILAVVGLYIRYRLTETPEFLKRQKQHQPVRIPIAKLLHRNWRELIVGIATVCLMAVIIGVVFLGMAHYLQHVHDWPLHHALMVNTMSILIFSLSIPFFGFISDYVGRKKLLITSALFMAIFAYPLFSALHNQTNLYFWLALIGLDLLAALAISVVPATLSELFRTDTRVSGIGLSYNISFGLFGGLAPLVVLLFTRYSHDASAASFYVICAAIVTLLAAFFIKDRRQQPLN